MSALSMPRLQVLALLIPPVIAADAWDDFANNLATDLAPIIQLFGEQVTKQFLSESTSLPDNIIFAMGPLGILTAVVSVIRVCGNPMLRAFIGRAQEGAGIAEAELCSSTGRDVCEMYQNGAITRVFGRPKLLEIVHDSSEEDFYAYGRSKEQPTSGIFTFAEHQITPLGRMEWLEDGPLRSTRSTAEDASPKVENFAPNPNLALNIGMKRPGQFELIILAVFGILLQISVIAFAILITCYMKLPKDGKVPQLWALGPMIGGTILLCSGMFLCAFLIEQSTNERSFRRSTPPKEIHSDSRSVLYWIQPGGQIVGDQSFDPFAFSDKEHPLQTYTSSWRNHSRDDVLWTWLAITLTMVGFILQFVGLRALHAAVSVYHIASILLMSVLRALLRTRRLSKNDNHIARWDPRFGNAKVIQNGPMNFPSGHELDWLALELCQKSANSSKPKRNWFHSWSLGNALLGSAPLEPARDDDLAQQSDAISDANLDQSSRCVRRLSSSPIYMIAEDENVAEWLRKSEFGSSQAGICAGARAWRYRSRLCQLTSTMNPRVSLQRSWPDTMVQGRPISAALANSISSACTIILRRLAITDSDIATKKLFMRFQCEMHCGPTWDHQTNTQDTGYLHFSLQGHRDMDSERFENTIWSADEAQLEAAIAMQTWSILSEQHRVAGDTGSSPSPFGQVNMRRILCAAFEDELEEFLRLKSNVNTWAERDTLVDAISTLKFPGKHLLHPRTIWQQTSYGHGTVSQPLRYFERPVSKPNMRYFGWNSVSPTILRSNDKPVMVLSSRVYGSLPQMCAHDLFTGFLRALLLSTEEPLGGSKFDSTSKRYSIKNEAAKEIIAAFVESGLGTDKDAVACLIPAIVSSGCLSPALDALESVYESINTHIAKGEYNEAGRELEWAPNLLRYSVSETVVIKLYFQMTGFYGGWLSHVDENAGDAYSKSTAMADDQTRIAKGIDALLTHYREVQHTEVAETLRDIWVLLVWNYFKAFELQRRLGEPIDTRDLELFVTMFLEPEGLQDRIGIVKTSPTTLLSAVTLPDIKAASIFIKEIYTKTYMESAQIEQILSHVVTHHGKTWRLLEAELLQRMGASYPPPPSSQPFDRDALSWACLKGEFKATCQLVESGYPLDREDVFGRNAFHYSIAKNRLDIVKYFGSLLSDRKMKFKITRIMRGPFWTKVDFEDIGIDMLEQLLASGMLATKKLKGENGPILKRRLIEINRWYALDERSDSE